MTSLIDPTRFRSSWAHQLPQLRAAHEAVRAQEQATPDAIESARPSVPLLLVRLGAEAPALARVAAVLLDRTQPLDATELRGLLRLMRDLSHAENALLHALRDAGLVGPNLWSTLVVPAQDEATREHQQRAGALHSGLVRAGLALTPLAAGLVAGLWLAGPVGGAAAMGVQLLIGLAGMPWAMRHAERAQLERTESLGIDLTPPTNEVEVVIDRLLTRPVPAADALPSELSMLRLLAETRAVLGPSKDEAPMERALVHRTHDLVQHATSGATAYADFTRAWTLLRKEATLPTAVRQRLQTFQREAVGLAVPVAGREATTRAAERYAEATVGPWLERAQGTGIALRARVESSESRADGSTIVQGVLTHGWLRRDRGTFTVTVRPDGRIEPARSSIRLSSVAAGELAASVIDRENARTAGPGRSRGARVLDTRDVGRHGFEVIVASGSRMGAISVTRDGLVDPSSLRWFSAE